MKTNLYHAFLSLLMCPVALTGCSSSDSDMPDSSAPDELVPVHFNLDFKGLSGVPASRSLAPGYKFSDGTSVSVLKGYVYNQANGTSAAPIKVVDIDIKDVNENRGGDVSILLPKGQFFDIVFLGTSVPQDDISGKLYYNSSDRSLTVNYAGIACNDEELDCFYALQKDVTTETALINAVELTRPFAQLNIGTQDYAEYNAATPIKDISVSVDGIYNKISLLTGEPVGDPVKVDFQAAAIPGSDQIFPVSGFSYVSMNYLLCYLRKLVDISVSLNHVDGTRKVIDFKKVAIERNYQTNIYGKNLLHKASDITNEPDDPYADYDLVLSTVDKNMSCMMSCISFLKGLSSIDLIDSVDSNGLIKVKWDDLGLQQDCVHIYFEYNTNLKELIKCDIDRLPINDLSYFFKDCTNLIDAPALKLWSTSNVKTMHSMFSGCSSLTSLDLSNFDTSNVQTMQGMFSGCSSLSSLDLSNFNTSNVIDMSTMFGNCSSLTSLDLSHFDARDVRRMSYMFSGCSALKSLEFSNFNYSYYLTDMFRMFEGCSSLTSLDLSSFRTSNVTNMGRMFERCSALTSLDLSGFSTSNVTNMDRMFEGCSSLTSLDLSSFDTSKVTDMGCMFVSCSALTSLDLSGFSTSNVTSMSNMFNKCSALTSLDLSSFDTSKVTYMSYMFKDCSSLTSLDLSSFDMRNVKYTDGMFEGCPAKIIW